MSLYIAASSTILPPVINRKIRRRSTLDDLKSQETDESASRLANNQSATSSISRLKVAYDRLIGGTAQFLQKEPATVCLRTQANVCPAVALMHLR